MPRREFDVWFFVNVGMGHHAALARLSGAAVVMNVDGLDWQRAKWGPIARGYFYSAAHSAVRYCTTLVTDAEAMRVHYRDHFKRDSAMIAYGATIEQSVEPQRIAAYGVAPKDYYLIVSRLIPENSLGVMLEGFRESRTRRKLIVVGGTHYRDEFHRRLEAVAASDPRIEMVGQITDQSVLKELWCNCYGYLHGHSVGGTNPALLRAMGYGACVLARDTVFNREVIGSSGLFFEADPTMIAKLINHLDATPGLVDLLSDRGVARIRDRYTWDKIVDEYERVFTEAVAIHRGVR
jgi:glycosyltransferase involved in cell wall biosynthesis